MFLWNVIIKYINFINSVDEIHFFLMDNKYKNSWQTRFFEIKDNKIFWQMSKNSQKASNYIDIKEIKEINKVESNDFELVLEAKNYVLAAESEEIRDKWFDTIKSLIHDIMNENSQENKIVYDNVLSIELKESLLIKDLENIPDISADKEFIKNKIEKDLKSGNHFLHKEKKQ